MMPTEPLPTVDALILAVLDKQGRDFLTVKQVVSALPSAVRRRLALVGTQSATALAQTLTPHLGDRVQVYRGSRSTYLGRQMPLDELILRQLRQKPGVSSRQLGRQIPVLKTAYLTALNALLQRGQVVCTLRHDHTPTLRAAAAPVAAPTPAAPPSPVPAIDDRQALRAAYDRVGQGRPFVRIHRLRSHLQWPRERFDRLLRQLRADYAIELHGGDPSQLTEAEVRDSFLDEQGLLYITLSWSAT